MEPPESTPDPDQFFRRLTTDEHAGLRTQALAAARAELPCSRCGSVAEPIARRPERLSYQWWDDPSPYLACRDCGNYLEALPVWLQYPAWFMADR